MKKGTIVSWQIQGAANRGRGIIITDEQDGHVLVSVDYFGEQIETILGYHPVINCTVTWLTIEQ